MGNNTLSIIIQHLFLAIWIPLFCSQMTNINLSGKMGLDMAEKLSTLVGRSGITLLLTVSLLIFLISIFNIKIEYFTQLIKSIVEHIKNAMNINQIQIVHKESTHAQENLKAKIVKANQELSSKDFKFRVK